MRQATPTKIDWDIGSLKIVRKDGTVLILSRKDSRLIKKNQFKKKSIKKMVSCMKKRNYEIFMARLQNDSAKKVTVSTGLIRLLSSPFGAPVFLVNNKSGEF